ncbi:MAG: hypothetical protein GF331_03265 [Chitinivibrionales bacterium]|nr:hypothetical protein [Chitinivibrionales bacterium]
MQIGTYSLGVGDRFGREGKAQLMAVARAKQAGIDVVPVWNKSHREHTIIGTSPADVRTEADAAVRALGWQGQYFVDADHIGLKTVDAFIESADFFTLDVADYTGQAAADDAIDSFVRQHGDLVGTLTIAGIDEQFTITPDDIRDVARKYLLAVNEAGQIYRHVAERKGADAFVAEVSMDETDTPQTPVELLFILAMIADEGIPAQTIAPRFSGRFNKGVDYVGDVALFAREFEQDVLVIAHAVERFGLPPNLKLSVHSGSDKFAIYGPIREVLHKHGAGVHLKTAGTTWLEEIIGLAAAGGDGLALAKDIYRTAFGRFDELCGPYASVIDIDRDALPAPPQVEQWSADDFVEALRHDRSCSRYDPNLRQMLHVGYKVAAELGERFHGALEEYEDVIAPHVTQNIFERHIKPVFIG